MLRYAFVAAVVLLFTNAKAVRGAACFPELRFVTAEE